MNLIALAHALIPSIGRSRSGLFAHPETLSEQELEKILRTSSVTMAFEPRGTREWEEAERHYRAALTERMRRQGFAI